MLMNGWDVGAVIETAAGLKTLPLCYVVMAPAQMAPALLPGAQAEAQKGP
jgi:hypothetical protein